MCARPRAVGQTAVTFRPERLEHLTIGATLNSYSHVTVGMEADAAEKLPQRFSACDQSVTDGPKMKPPQVCDLG